MRKGCGTAEGTAVPPPPPPPPGTRKGRGSEEDGCRGSFAPQGEKKMEGGFDLSTDAKRNAAENRLRSSAAAAAWRNLLTLLTATLSMTLVARAMAMFTLMPEELHAEAAFKGASAKEMRERERERYVYTYTYIYIYACYPPQTHVLLYFPIVHYENLSPETQHSRIPDFFETPSSRIPESVWNWGSPKNLDLSQKQIHVEV